MPNLYSNLLYYLCLFLGHVSANIQSLRLVGAVEARNYARNSQWALSMIRTWTQLLNLASPALDYSTGLACPCIMILRYEVVCLSSVMWGQPCWIFFRIITMISAYPSDPSRYGQPHHNGLPALPTNGCGTQSLRRHSIHGKPTMV